jgi:phosphoribosylanthranilate isomerase
LNKPKIKICGIKDIGTLECCIKNKVDFFGLIFYKKSPRNISIDDALKLIHHSKNKKIKSVGVFVNEPIDKLNLILKKLKVDYIQLHGEEDERYISEVKKHNSIKIIKNIPIQDPVDLLTVNNYPNADMFLFDYKPMKNELPGGNSKKFSWELIKNIEIDKPWFISGGINIKNINKINNFTIPYGIDISSGVEEMLGIKSNNKITLLIESYESK